MFYLVFVHCHGWCFFVFGVYMLMMVIIDGIGYTFQVCPACGQKVGMDLVAHITTQHAKFFKISFLKFGFFVLFFIFLLV